MSYVHGVTKRPTQADILQHQIDALTRAVAALQERVTANEKGVRQATLTSDIWAGNPRKSVDAGKARAHINALTDSGLRTSDISRVTGVGPSIISSIRTGKKRTCSGRTESMILAVQPKEQS